jgi:hypothetical protein
MAKKVDKRDKSIATLTFNEEITKETTEALVAGIEKQYAEGFDYVILYFASIGGDGSFAYLMIDYFNENSDRLELRFFDRLYSAGSWIAKFSSCKKVFLPELVVMIHTSNIADGDFKTIHKKHLSATWGIAELNKQSNITFLDAVKEHLLSNEIRLYKQNKDVYIIDQERIKKMLQ